MVIMKKLILTLLIAIFCNIGNHVFSQSRNDSLVLSLKEELFPFHKDATMVEISTLCENEDIKADYMIYFRQPDFKSVLNVLYRIAFTKDASLIPIMENVRREYIGYLKKDWEPLFNLKYGDCKVMIEKIQIFQCIEETLLSLKFAKMELGKQEGFNYYVDVQRRWYKSLNDNENGNRAFEDFEGFSPYYLDLMRNRIAGSPELSFDFIEPHLEELKEPLIEYLEKYYIEGLIVQKLELEGYVFFRVLNSISEEKNPTLLNMLINILITNKYVSKIEISRNIITILRKSEPKGLLERKIIEQLYQPTGVDKMNAILASSYIFRSDFVDVLLDIKNVNTFTNEENEYLKRVFLVLSKRPYITDVQRENIDRILRE